MILERQRQARSHLKFNPSWSHEWGPVHSFSERPWPIQRFRTLLIVARRKRLGHASPAVPVTETRKPGTMLVIECGRPEGYIEQKLAKLSDLVNEGLEIGATHVGWG